MSITSTSPRQRYTGNGVTTSFAVPFQFDLDSDLKVIIYNTITFVSTIKTLSTHYTVTGGGGESGTVTMFTAPSATEILVLVNNPSPTQDFSVAENGSFPTADVENAFDRVTLIAQRAYDLAGRSIHVSDSDGSAFSGELPSEDERANKFLAFDASGDPIASDGGISDAIPVSAYMETLLDDADAAAARGTLGFTGALNTVQTALIEDSAVITTKINDLAVTAAKIDTQAVTPAKLANLSVAGRQGFTINIGIAKATTTIADDSVKITSSDGSALSASNPGYVVTPGTTPGTLAVFQVTADVTIKATGAHWGMGTKGDFNVFNRVYAINDAGTLKWGLSNLGGYRSITVALSNATATSITLQTHMLVTSTLAGTSGCAEIGWIRGTFDDTGGTAEDLWAFSSAAGNIGVGIPCPVYTDLGTVTVTSTFSNCTMAARAVQKGARRRYEILGVLTGTPANAALAVSLPTGDVMDTTKLLSLLALFYPKLGSGEATDFSNNNYPLDVVYSSASAVALMALNAAGTYATSTTQATQAVPFTFGTSDAFSIDFEVPLLGWSDNA